ncbi:MAG: hypothetical protein ABSF26_26190, partial [Thermoguttaceae bacterium]
MNPWLRLSVVIVPLWSSWSNAAAAVAPASSDTLPIPVLEQWGKGGDRPGNLVGPRKFAFTPPRTGRCLGLTGRLESLGTAWALSLGAEEKTLASLALSCSDPARAMIEVSLSLPQQAGLRTKYFIKPNLAFYPGEDRAGEFCFKLVPRAAFAARRQVEEKYHLFVSATQHRFTLRLERSEGGLTLWLDGRFLARIPPEVPLIDGLLDLAPGNELLQVVDSPALESGVYLPLDLAGYARPGSLQFLGDIAGLPPSRPSTLDGVPLLPVGSAEHIDVGLSRWLEEAIDPPDFCDNDATRSAFDGNPESIILQVPKANYRTAHVLCAVEANADKAPVLTLRVTRFGNHYGDSGGRGAEAFADTTVCLLREAAAKDRPGPVPPSAQRKGDFSLPPGARQVGEIRAKVTRGSGGRGVVQEELLPVYLVPVPLRIGEIADLLGEDAAPFGRRKNYFDLELTKEIRTAVQFFNLQSCRRKPLGLPSAVHVFAVTLEKSPVDVVLSSTAPGNIFCADEEASLDVQLSNRSDAAANLNISWETRDYYGQQSVKSWTIALPGRNAGGVARTKIPLAGPKLGYYSAVLTVKDEHGRELWRQPTTFALLPKDTRTAGDESPFGAWWFSQTHGCCDRLEWMGPILRKLGMRHCCPGPFSEEQLRPYKLSYSMVPWYDRQREAFIARHPHVRLGMVFHETGGPAASLPYPELLGGPKPEIPKDAEARWRQLWKQALETARWYRQEHPRIKITLGNSPSGLMVWLMRQKFPKEYVDCFGMEGPAAWTTTECQPKRSSMQEVWWLSEMRKIYGYQDVPVSSGFEYIGRCTSPGALSEEQQAELHVRDALHCLAYGYPSINIGLADDCADSYYYTIYGSSGFVHRHPLLTPKPSYVAWATMTQVLDGAKYRRCLDSGSNSLYVLEFGGRGKQVYPVWTVRGKRGVSLEISGGGAELVDCMGNARRLSAAGGVSFEATTAPAYVVTAGTVTKVTVGRARFEEAPPENPCVVSDFSDPDAWEVESAPDRYLETYAEDLPAAMGKFSLKAIADEEKGKVIECTLAEQPSVPSLFPRYASLKLKQPIRLPREVRRLGMWVKGNSCWGRVYWEFLDAHGERYFSAADETSGWEVSDWRDRSAINFDGW